jgi:ABC-type antimicrobial peptide transport system permease subunit
VKCLTIDFTATVGTLYSYEYCLKTYSPYLANGTIRVEYYLNGTLGVNNNDFTTKDLGTLNWYNSFRLAGYFTYVESTYTEERVLYNTGERLFVSDEQEPEYRMQLKQQPEFLHNVFRTDVMQADDVYITDYNSRLPINLITKNVYKNSSYSPRWNFLKSKLASVEVKWKQKFNNHKKLRY